MFQCTNSKIDILKLRCFLRGPLTIHAFDHAFVKLTSAIFKYIKKSGQEDPSPCEHSEPPGGAAPPARARSARARYATSLGVPARDTARIVEGRTTSGARSEA